MICGREFSPEVIARINGASGELSRRALSRELCRWLDWKGPSGSWQTTNARVALRRLEYAGHVRLPACVSPFVRRNRRRAAPPRPAWPPVHGSLAQIGPVELILVGSRHSKVSRQCQQLLRQWHPLGERLCGAQLRYVISCPQGILGVLAFSAAARRLRARDQWIGWSEAVRRENLHLVVNNSRFLIRPGVEVRHLASRVLAQAARRLPSEWQQRYGYAPVLLESFVEKSRYRGTSYRASNWTELAIPSAGRGRQDRQHRSDKTAKRIFVYALRRDARARLCTTPAQPRLAVPVKPRRERPPAADWAEEEFGAARLGDVRLVRRLCGLARDFYARPQGNLPQRCGSDRARAKAAYRFFDHHKVNLQSVLHPHYEATGARLRRETIVLAVQDTTSLNYSTHPATENLGPITSEGAGKVLGLLVHGTLAFNVAGTPLGLLDVQCWARDPAQFGQRHRRRERPFEEKESVKWRRSLEALARVQAQCPATRLVSVGDREADVYEVFWWATAEPGRPGLLVRAEYNRRVRDEHRHLWEQLAAQPLAGIRSVSLPRRANRPARIAQLEVRFAAVELRPPHTRRGLPPVRVWAVWARELDVPRGMSPVEWMLLSTVPVVDLAGAQEKLDWYTRRWGIEVFHRTLKSGCQIEQRQLGSADRLAACLGVDLVVAWRIFNLAKLGRETPEVPCTVYFEAMAWQALVGYMTKSAIAPKAPPNLGDAMRMVAKLGGFLGRAGDGQPGTQTLWLGLQRLDDITAGWTIVSELLTRTVSSKPDYG